MTYGFHPEAFEEYQASAIFYLQETSEATSQASVAAIEAGIEEILHNPDKWRIVEPPQIRRYVCGRFPFVLYYR